MCYRKKVSASKNPNHSSPARTPLAGLLGTAAPGAALCLSPGAYLGSLGTPAPCARLGAASPMRPCALEGRCHA